MASTSDIAKRYFAALAAHDLDDATACWKPVVELTTARHRTAVRWRAHGAFAGPGAFQGFAPNHARVKIEGCDVVTVEDGLIVHNDAYIDSGNLARQLAPRVVLGHADPVTGDVRRALEQAAEAP